MLTKSKSPRNTLKGLSDNKKKHTVKVRLKIGLMNRKTLTPSCLKHNPKIGSPDIP